MLLFQKKKKNFPNNQSEKESIHKKSLSRSKQSLTKRWAAPLKKHIKKENEKRKRR